MSQTHSEAYFAQPLGLTRSQNELFDLICNVDQCAPPQNAWFEGDDREHGTPRDASDDSSTASPPAVYRANGSNDSLALSTMDVFHPMPAIDFNFNIASPSSSSVSSVFWPGSPAGSELRNDSPFATESLTAQPSGSSGAHGALVGEQLGQWPLFTSPSSLSLHFNLPDSTASAQDQDQDQDVAMPAVNPLDIAFLPVASTPVAQVKRNEGPGPIRRSGRKALPSAPYPQPQLQDVLDDDDEYEEENSSKSGDKKPFACEICSTRFCRDFERVRHLKSHLDQNLTCGICNKVIKNGRKDALRRHQLRTRKCVAKQVGMSDEALSVAGCVTSSDRAIWQARVSKPDDDSEE